MNATAHGREVVWPPTIAFAAAGLTDSATAVAKAIDDAVIQVLGTGGYYRAQADSRSSIPIISRPEVVQ